MKLQKYKKPFIISLVVLCLLMFVITAIYQTDPTFVENGLGYVVVPVQRAMRDASNWFSRRISFLTSINTLDNENLRLKEENYQLELEIDRLKLMEDDNLRLTELLQIDQKYPDYPKVGARVVGTDTGNWYSTFIINKGTNDGLTRNMIALGAGGLVGRVIEARANHSKVIALIDDTSSIAVKSVRTNETGILKGDMMLMQSGLCKMEYIDINADIQEGDEIVTSHLSGTYPQGLSVGVVTQVTNDLNSITKTATVKPTVDFKQLEEVLVITEVFDVTFDE